MNPLAGRYRGAGGDGRYNPANDGRYVPSDDGRYTHIAGKDGPGDAGYVGGVFKGGPGGKYVGANGNGGGAGGSGFGGGGANKAGGRNQGGSNRAAVAATTQKSYVTKGAPPEGWAIIRNEKTESTDGYHYLYDI